MRASGSFWCAWTRRPSKSRAAPSSQGICIPASSPYAWVTMLQSSVRDELAPVATRQAACTPRTNVLNEGEAPGGATTEAHSRYASAVYQSLLPSIVDSTAASALSDEPSEDGDELPKGEVELPLGPGVVAGALGPREETHVTVTGG